MSRWISVNDRYPQLSTTCTVDGDAWLESEKVFVYALDPNGVEDVGIGVLCMDEETGLYWDGVTYGEYVLTECRVTHWSEIPKAPQAVDEAKAAKREYARRWRKEHPENVRAAQERYWEKRAAMEQSMAAKGEVEG